MKVPSIAPSIAPSAPPPDYDWTALLAACEVRGLTAHVAAHPLPTDDLINAATRPRPGEPYGRTPLFRNHVGEVLLVHWREDTFCAPHDHGDAGGFIHLLRGQFTERLWRWREGNLVAAVERAYEAPTIMEVRGGAIHDMKARGSGVGVHFYLPAIRGMRVFDRERRETLVVSDNCGAWVPQDTGLIEGRTVW